MPITRLRVAGYRSLRRCTLAESLATQLARATGEDPIRLEKVAGETRLVRPPDDDWEPSEEDVPDDDRGLPP
jgi:hypothetical protein